MDRSKLYCEERDFREYANKISCGCLLTNERMRKIIMDLFIFLDGTTELKKLSQEAHAQFIFISDKNGKPLGYDYTVMDGVERTALQTITFFRNIFVIA